MDNEDYEDIIFMLMKHCPKIIHITDLTHLIKCFLNVEEVPDELYVKARLDSMIRNKNFPYHRAKLSQLMYVLNSEEKEMNPHTVSGSSTYCPPEPVFDPFKKFWIVFDPKNNQVILKTNDEDTAKAKAANLASINKMEYILLTTTASVSLPQPPVEWKEM